MCNSFVLFDVSIVISHGQFHCGYRGHTQNTDSPWVKSHYPVGKRSSGTATNDCSLWYHYCRTMSQRVVVLIQQSVRDGKSWKLLSATLIQNFKTYPMPWHYDSVLPRPRVTTGSICISRNKQDRIFISSLYHMHRLSWTLAEREKWRLLLGW